MGGSLSHIPEEEIQGPAVPYSSKAEEKRTHFP
jgi:hypothetical protein